MCDSTNEESGPGDIPEATLFEQAQAGCQDSLNALMARHERLVHLVVRRQWLCTLTYEEGVQEGRRGLWRAILGFDPRRGKAFATYAYGAIMRYVWGAVKDELRRLRREVPLGVLVLYWYEAGPDPAWERERQEIGQSLQALVERLPKRLGLVIRDHYGLEGREAHTFRAIGVRLGVCGERIRQLHSEALVWLRQPAHSQELRHLLARHTQAQYELADRMAQAWLRRRGGRYGRRFDT
jgi:RNA polymerase sigma factor (sigma-70 family)